MTKRLFFPLVTLWFAVFVLSAQLHPAAQARGGAPISLPDGAGKDLVQDTCSKCHSLALLTGGFGYTRADWEKVVGSMVALRKTCADICSLSAAGLTNTSQALRSSTGAAT